MRYEFMGSKLRRFATRRAQRRLVDSFLLSVAAIHSARALRPLITHQLGASLWNRMRIGFTLSFSQPCSGHSNLCGNLIAPGTGFTTSFALHFGQFKRSPFAAM